MSRSARARMEYLGAAQKSGGPGNYDEQLQKAIAELQTHNIQGEEKKRKIEQLAQASIEAKKKVSTPLTPNEYCIIMGIVALLTGGLVGWDVYERTKIRARTYSADDDEPSKANSFVAGITVAAGVVAGGGILAAAGPAIGLWEPSKRPFFYQNYPLILQLLACFAMSTSRLASMSDTNSDESHQTEKKVLLWTVMAASGGSILLRFWKKE